MLNSLFVDDYEPQTVRPVVLPDKNPSNMLDIYLSGLRTLKRRGAGATNADMLNVEDVRIFIVECWDDTRAEVREFGKKYQLKKYDGSIPAIHVFQSGKLIHRYTYHRNPGHDGGELKSLVRRLLTESEE